MISRPVYIMAAAVFQMVRKPDLYRYYSKTSDTVSGHCQKSPYSKVSRIRNGIIKLDHNIMSSNLKKTFSIETCPLLDVSVKGGLTVL